MADLVTMGHGSKLFECTFLIGIMDQHAQRIEIFSEAYPIKGASMSDEDLLVFA